MESSIHPKLLKKLLEVLNETLDDCKLIISSHSPYLIQYLKMDQIYVGNPSCCGVANFKKVKGNRPKDIVRIGLYAAKSDDWRKNLFAQIAAASLIDNVVIDMVPLNPEAKSLANVLGVKLDEEANNCRGVERLISAEDSKVKVYIVPTNEEVMIARDVVRLTK